MPVQSGQTAPPRGKDVTDAERVFTARDQHPRLVDLEDSSRRNATVSAECDAGAKELDFRA